MTSSASPGEPHPAAPALLLGARSIVDHFVSRHGEPAEVEAWQLVSGELHLRGMELALAATELNRLRARDQEVRRILNSDGDDAADELLRLRVQRDAVLAALDATEADVVRNPTTADGYHMRAVIRRALGVSE